MTTNNKAARNKKCVETRMEYMATLWMQDIISDARFFASIAKGEEVLASSWALNHFDFTTMFDATGARPGSSPEQQ